MLTLDNTTLTALATPGCALAQLIDLDLPVPWRVNTAGVTLVVDGETYLGVPVGAGRIEVIEESEGEIRGLSFELPAIIDADLATALAGVPVGAAVRIYTVVYSQSATALTAVYTKLEWAGRADVPVIRETGKGAVIALTAEHVGIDLLRPSGLLYSNADQQRLYPGDKSFEYVVSQANKPIVWPAASYFRK